MGEEIEKKVVKYLETLVSIRSVSGEEREVAHRIKEIMDAEGVDKAFIDKYGNVIGVVKGAIDKSIVYEGHMDHVPEGDLSNWVMPPYEPKIVNGNIYGRATVDMKGAIAAMLSSISMIKEPHPTIYLVFVSQEEIAEGVLLKYAMEDSLGIRPDLVVLGEATNLNISIGQRGRAVIHVRIRGETAHASMPEKGMNALAASTFIMDRVLRLKNKLPSHRLLGRSTVTPTIIECTPKSPPMVPDHCFINIDRRFIVGEDEDKILGEIEFIANKALEKNLARDVKVYIPVEPLPLWNGRKLEARHFFPAWITERNRIIKSILRLVKRRVFSESRFMAWRFSTDGVYSAGIAGIPTIGFGPGDEGYAHKPNENVPIKHLIKAVDGYTKISTTFID